MPDFTGEKGSGSHFEDVEMTGAESHSADLPRARLQSVDGAPLISAELDRRDPELGNISPKPWRSGVSFMSI